MSALNDLALILFWLSAGLLVFTHFGYPVALWLLDALGVGGDVGQPRHRPVGRIALVVAPLMLVELATAGWLVIFAGERGILFLVSVAFLLLNWASTGLIQVPLHRRLEREGFDAGVCRRLTRRV